MRTRLVALTLGLYLSLALSGCSGKKADSTASSDNGSSPAGSTTAPANDTAAPASGTASSEPRKVPARG